MLLGIFFTACSSGKKKEDPQNQNATPGRPSRESIQLIQFGEAQPGSPTAVMETTMGTINIRFFPEQAPKAVENFLTLAEQGFYNGKLFHQVSRGFMIQGGALSHTGEGGTSIYRDTEGNTIPFETEWDINLWHFRGALSMVAGTAAEGDSHLSQFRIIQNDHLGEDMLSSLSEAGHPDIVIEKYKETGGAPHLDSKNTVFGQVTKGMDVVDQICRVKATGGRPQEDVIILKVTVRR